MARIERDPLGEYAVPDDAYYGIQTARAVENFPISGLRAPAQLITATVFIKKSAAQANVALGRLDARSAARSFRRPTRSSRRADRPVHRGRVSSRRRHVAQHERQRGAGQSRVRDSWRREGRIPAGPSQRSRQHGTVHQRRVSDGDASGVAARASVAGGRGDGLASSLARKADLFASVLKVGRTHLQDAVPITLARSSAAMPAASIARPATSSVL
jgi:hypothetical protein